MKAAILLDGLITTVMDAASGANYEYPSDVRLELAAEALPALPPLALQSPTLAPDTVGGADAAFARSQTRSGARIRPIAARAVSY